MHLDRDLPTTAEDVAALRRLRAGRPTTFEEYLRFLASFDPPSHEDLRKKRGPRGDTLFQLIP